MRFAFPLLSAVLVFAASAPSVRAQTPPAPAAAPPPVVSPPVPADVQKTFSDIADLLLLRALVPVKLQAAQIDKILPVLQAVKSEGAARRKSDEAAVRAVSAEVAKARDAAIGQGTSISPETEAKVVKVFDDADKRFADAKKAALDRITPVLQVTLTSDQQSTIKTYVENKMLGGKKFSTKAKPDAVQTAALEIYAERILLDERSIEVLTRLRAAAQPAPAAPAPKP